MGKEKIVGILKQINICDLFVLEAIGIIGEVE